MSDLSAPSIYVMLRYSSRFVQSIFHLKVKNMFIFENCFAKYADFLLCIRNIGNTKNELGTALTKTNNNNTHQLKWLRRSSCFLQNNLGFAGCSHM